MDASSALPEQTEAALGEALAQFLRRHRKVAVLTGAGVSTASGIPDYRDTDGQWKHSRPVMYEDFRRHAHIRRRYWARSLVGWEYFRRARPNTAHAALATLENAGHVRGLVTQNVDRLHQQAGHREVLDLHGRLDQVVCLDCGEVSEREEMQLRLQAANPVFEGRADSTRPDGDAELAQAGIEDTFEVPGCRRCGGMLKPAVVFFGEGVPRDWVRQATAHIDEADALLVVGSSLMVFSGFRFARHAAKSGKPVAILGLGRTRADELASLRLAGDCGGVLNAALGTL